MKRILFIDNSRPTKNGGIGGSINSMLQLINRLDKKKFKIYVLLYYRLPLIESKLNFLEVTPIYKNNELPKDSKNKIKYSIINFLPFVEDLHILKNLKEVYYLSSIFKKYKIDFIHGNNRIAANTLCIIAAKKCKINYIQHQRKFEVKIGFISSIYKNYPNYYIAISGAIRKNISRKVNVRNSKVKLIHNWINPNTLIRKKYIKKDNKFRILWLGRIVPWKGIDVLINIAIEMIKNDFGNFKIDIFGDYVELEYKNMINSIIKKHNLKEYIFLKGFKEIQKIPVENYNVYIHTSKKPEPFGRTIIECMSLNIPVCATAMGGVLDIINHKNNGILYDYKNYQKLVPLLRELKSDNDYKDRLIYNANKTINEKFSGDLQTKIINEIYESI
ncbi:glycosyltransferase family 4 protein [Candidatus Marinimicrobia bacterium]|nr:glycosyltransferase family 4 protein [Candidatus Neomarinimicrobiota bacterium]